MARSLVRSTHFLRFGLILALLILTLGISGTAFAAADFDKGLSLYHEGNAEAAFNVFRDLHSQHPTGTGKYLYMMSLSAHKMYREHDALRYLNMAITQNPSLSFARNKSHVLHLKRHLEQELSNSALELPATGGLPPAPLAPITEHRSSNLMTIGLIAVVAIAVLIFAAGKITGGRAREAGSLHKKNMEETGARLMAAVDKLRDEKNYYLLDKPDKKAVLEAAFAELDKAYVAALMILKEPDSPQTDWNERHARFEASLVPVDAAILKIRTLMGESAEAAPAPSPSPTAAQASSAPQTPPGDAYVANPQADPNRCVFCGADASAGKTISLERDGKVAYAKACPKCLSEMEQNYQRTGTYAPPQSFYQGGMPFMGGGLSFGDMMLLDWMMHSNQEPVHVDMSDHQPGVPYTGDSGMRDDRTGSMDGSMDRS
jgi:hypothetical protein